MFRCPLISLKYTAVMAVLISTPAASQQQQPQQAPKPSLQWEQLPLMQLEQMYRGPLQDTVIQRWRDPTSGLICYVYLPITAAHTDRQASGYVQYGSNNIGSISCLNAAPPAAAPVPARNAPNRPLRAPEPAR
jgi:hypothetical protein